MNGGYHTHYLKNIIFTTKCKKERATLRVNISIVNLRLKKNGKSEQTLNKTFNLMTLNLEKFTSKNVVIYENSLTYKSFLKPAQTVIFSDVKEMTAVYIVDGNRESYYLSLFDSKWHYIKLNSFNKECRLEILSFMHQNLSPIVLPKQFENFDKGIEINLGLFSVVKTIGIVRTNNVIREIRWSEIDLFEYTLSSIGVGFACIKFNNEVFEFSFQIGSIKQHTFLLEIMIVMIGSDKIIYKTTNIGV